jgi:hypothetical protein
MTKSRLKGLAKGFFLLAFLLPGLCRGQKPELTLPLRHTANVGGGSYSPNGKFVITRSKERVPVLASGIGGIQAPQVFSPYGSQSFDIGELAADEKARIPIAKARPIYIRSNFIDEQKLRDVLGFGKKMDEALNETSARGEFAPLFFVDVSEYPEGCQLSGLYKQAANGRLSLRLNKVCEGREITYFVEAGTESELKQKVLEIVTK